MRITLTLQLREIDDEDLHHKISVEASLARPQTPIRLIAQAFATVISSLGYSSNSICAQLLDELCDDRNFLENDESGERMKAVANAIEHMSMR